VVCDNAATLVYLANQAVITPHVWLSRADKLEFPDRLVLDLDPPGEDVELVRWAALTARDFLRRELDLQPWVMSTGSRGVHLCVPLDRTANFDEVRKFAHEAAELLARRHPDRLTIEARKNKRGQRVFIDALRNSYAATTVAAYAVRALPGAPVAAPLDWAEVEAEDFHPQRYNLKTMQQRSESELSPWAAWPKHGVSLEKVRELLQRVLQPA
jgi:bifunctional non-homologous end joining protein LigD